MTYIEGFVIAVPTANRQKFIDHAHLGDTVFMEHGATRVVECWKEDVPKGKINDFFGAVASREDESIVDRKSTRLNSVTNAHLVCRLLREKKIHVSQTAIELVVIKMQNYDAKADQLDGSERPDAG